MAREKTKERKKNSTILRSVTISLGDVMKFSQTTSRAPDNDVSLFLAVGETKINLLFNAPSSGRCPPVDRGFSRGGDDGITMETKSPLFYSLSRMSMSRQGKKGGALRVTKKEEKIQRGQGGSLPLSSGVPGKLPRADASFFSCSTASPRV